MKLEQLNTHSGTPIKDIDTGKDAAEGVIDAHAQSVIAGDCLEVIRPAGCQYRRRGDQPAV